VIDNFAKIDQVPSGYFYQEIYASKKEPQYLKALEIASKKHRGDKILPDITEEKKSNVWAADGWVPFFPIMFKD